MYQLIDREWLLVHGSWLMAKEGQPGPGARGRARPRGAPGPQAKTKDLGARPQTLGLDRRRLAMSDEP